MNLQVLFVAPFVAVLGCSSAPKVTRETELPRVKLRDAALVQFRGANSPSPDQPGECDCNNPAHWDGETLYLFNSAGHPWRSSGPDLFHLSQSYQRCDYNNQRSGGRWIECTWKDDDGTLYGWYHFEPTGICPGAHPDSPKMNLGLDKSRRETDKLAGRVARLFVRGRSSWEILFLNPGEPE